MEIRSEFEVERESEYVNLKRKLRIGTIENNLSSLYRELERKLKAIQGGIFIKKYGNLLGLLELEVQIPVITALAHYYDSSLRCLTFQDFQLVPTIEEYGQILDTSLNGGVPYWHLEQHASILTLLSITKTSQDELSDRLIAIKGTKGFSQRFLEAYLLQLSVDYVVY